MKSSVTPEGVVFSGMVKTEFPSLFFVADDISRICDSLTQLYNDSCVRSLSRADRVFLSVIIQKLRSHCRTIHHYRVVCEKARNVAETVSKLEKEEDLPF